VVSQTMEMLKDILEGDWNLQDWKMTDHQKTGGGICRTGKWRTKTQGCNLQDWKMTD